MRGRQISRWIRKSARVKRKCRATSGLRAPRGLVHHNVSPIVEAASARYAARDRWVHEGPAPQTPLQRYIHNACDPQNFEPNLALNLEIADLINAKKGNAPREAAVAIVQYINHRNPNVSMLALTLLDICVKNCGYAFQLQVSTKDFLNELVRRFPERPPIRVTRVQSRILELIEEWRSTICVTSKYREDLGFIRDMHRLLSYKGYTFPEVKKEDAAVLNPTNDLRSAEEMEEEERAAQSAKLQELIRRGTPHDLQEANKLMKIMAGFDTRRKTDYRAKAAEEVGKIQQKARLLEEMLQGYKPGDEIKEGDVFEELANALASAHPKIQKMCEEESEDTEAVAKLFEINDSIHRTSERYKLIKKGDLEGANRIAAGTLGISGAGVKSGPNNELSLIDFGGPEEEAAQPVESQQSQAAPQSKGNALEDDLLGLSMGDSAYGSGGALTLGSSSNGLADLAGPSSSQPIPAPALTAIPPPAQPQAAKANYDPFGMISSPAPASNAFNQPQLQQKAADPFAALSGNSRTASPFQFQQSVKPSPPPAAPQSATSLLGGDDEWTFSSALPTQPQQPQTNVVTVIDSSVKAVFHISRPAGANDYLAIDARISNKTPQPVSDFTLQLAVTKAFSLQLQPQSGRNLSPNQADGIKQAIRLQGVAPGKGSAVRMRWRASYTIAGQPREESGEVSNLGVL
ncbi:ADP-ribosylation factor-binding protein-like protein GGA1 [Aureobasidium subglaciale]|nr:ADP-ribosylation factor-binding protein-like protein GGA1 [Aureobasidium subglaciale]